MEAIQEAAVEVVGPAELPSTQEGAQEAVDTSKGPEMFATMHKLGADTNEPGARGTAETIPEAAMKPATLLASQEAQPPATDTSKSLEMFARGHSLGADTNTAQKRTQPETDMNEEAEIFAVEHSSGADKNDPHGPAAMEAIPEAPVKSVGRATFFLAQERHPAATDTMFAELPTLGTDNMETVPSVAVGPTIPTELPPLEKGRHPATEMSAEVKILGSDTNESVAPEGMEAMKPVGPAELSLPQGPSTDTSKGSELVAEEHNSGAKTDTPRTIGTMDFAPPISTGSDGLAEPPPPQEGHPPAPDTSTDAEIFAGERDTGADIAGSELDWEPPPAPLALAVVSRQRMAEDEAEVRSVAAGVFAISARLREVPATITKLQQQRKHVLNWVKSIADTLDDEEKRCKYVDVVGYLNQHEQGCDQMVLKSSDVASLCQQTMKAMASILLKVTSNYDLGGNSTGSLAGVSLLDTWNPQLVEFELQMVEQLSKELATSCGDLQNMTAGDRLSSCNTAIQSLENEMYAVDALGEAKEHLRRAQEWKKMKYEKREERAADEAALGVLEATVRDCRGKIHTQESLLQELQNRHGELRQRQKELERSFNMNMEQAIGGLRKLKEDALKQSERLQALKEAQLEATQSHFNEAHKQYQKKLQTLEAELFDTDKHAVNHIVFCLDHSSSMSGSRWTDALRALESFRAARMQQGSQDVVSLVAFSHIPTQILIGKPLTLDFVAELRSKIQPSGGTSYAPAWREIVKCTEYVQWFSRLIVVFITDGFARDIPQATDIARELHQQQSNRGSMNTFVVNIDQVVADDVLEPLVKAGNGGQTKLQAFGEATRLLANIVTGDMASHFQRLANLIDAREVCLRNRIGLVVAAEEEAKQQQLDALRHLEEQAELRFQSLRVSCARAEKANESDVKQVREMLRDQLGDVDRELMELQVSLDNETTRLRDLESSLAEYENKVRMQRLHLEDTAKVAEDEIKALGSCHQAAAADLDRLKMTQETLQRNFGSSDFETLKARLDELDDLKRLCKINHFQSRDQANGVGGLQRFFALLCKSIREPMGGSDLRLASKAGFVFARLLPERGVVLKDMEQPDSSVGLRGYLAREASNMGADAHESKKAIDLLFVCDVKSEDLCAACEKENQDEVEKVKKDMEKGLDDKFFELKGLGKQGKLQDKIKKLRTKRDEMEEGLPEGWEYIGDNTAAAKNREKVERLQEQIEGLECRLDEQKSDLRELAEFVLLKLLVRRAMDDCRSTYRKQIQRQTLQNLRSVLQSYNESVHKPMQELIANVNAVRAAYCIAGPADVAKSRLENGGPPRSRVGVQTRR